MQSSPQFARPFRASAAAARMPVEEGGANPEVSTAWKGWTNGIGDRVSTAVQFSRLADPSGPAVFAHGAATLTAMRAPAPVAPAAPPAPSYPVTESAVMAPVTAALERMLLRQQDHLAVTVRFEQGGSLSLRLAMRDGAIAAHFRTDVAGLEEALRIGWTSFAQDWNQRGVKLGSPTFAGGTASDDAAGRHGQSFADRNESDASGAETLRTLSSGRRSGRGTRRVSGVPSLQPATAGIAASGPGRRDLRTWA